jgi:RND family efflux transporter MFP subunit
MKFFSPLAPVCLLVLSTIPALAGEGHDHHEQQGEPEAQQLELTPVQRRLANIKVAAIQPKVISYQVYAPAEIKDNGYNSYFVSPRIDSVVVQRHVTLGEHVSKNQVLVTLFSEVMVEAQANYTLVQSEWVRMKQLGSQTVGEKKLSTAKTDFLAAKARLLAYGMSEQSIKLLNMQTATLGQYQLSAAIDGAVLADDFHQGQRVVAGEPLLKLVDESTLWIEASLPADTQLALPMGSVAQVKIGKTMTKARVAQQAHTIEPQSRTRTVRLVLDNPDDRFHAGMFADVYFNLNTKKPVMAVPQSALKAKQQNQWQVFIEQTDGHYSAQTVEIEATLGDWVVVHGIEPGVSLVVEGAFFVASQLAKDGFDPHNH